MKMPTLPSFASILAQAPRRVGGVWPVARLRFNDDCFAWGGRARRLDHAYSCASLDLICNVIPNIMIKNGLYALSATPRDGATDDVGGVLILRDGEIRGGDAYVYYTGNYECSAANNWQGELLPV